MNATEALESYREIIKEFGENLNLRDEKIHGHIDKLRGRISDLEAARNRIGLGAGVYGGDEDRDELNKAF